MSADNVKDRQEYTQVPTKKEYKERERERETGMLKEEG